MKHRKSFLKWVGSKYKILDDILSLIPTHNNYFEPFLGGGCVFLNVGSKCNGTFNLSDLNQELMLSWKEVKNRPQELIEELELLPKEWSIKDYYSIRDEIESASRMIYLNKMCFNGLYRLNRSGKFNVPIGSKREFSPPLKQIEEVSDYLKEIKTNFVCKSYEYILSEVKEGDFVYLDPPYCSSYNGYVGKGFSQEDLAQFCKKLHDKGVKFLLSNRRTEKIEKLYREFNMKSLDVFHSIGSKAGSRKKVSEVLIYNFST